MKQFFSSFGRGVLILLVIGGVLLYMTAGDMIVSLKPAVSFEDMLNGKEIKAGSHVAGNVVYALDYFASESTYTKYSDGSRSGDRKSGNYYLIPAANEGFVGLKSREVDVSALNKLSEETYDYMMNGTEPATEIFMEGTVEVMTGQLAGYFTSYLEEMGYTQAEIDAMGTPLVIQYRSFMAVRIMFLIGVVLVALAIFFFIRNYRRNVKGSGLPSADDLPSQRGNVPQL